MVRSVCCCLERMNWQFIMTRRGRGCPRNSWPGGRRSIDKFVKSGGCGAKPYSLFPGFSTCPFMAYRIARAVNLFLGAGADDQVVEVGIVPGLAVVLL